MSTVSDDKYLRAICQISVTEKSRKITISDLAYYLGFQPPTVLERIRRLQKNRYVSYRKDSGIQLTRAGTGEAMKVIRKHRIWETFLHKVCKFGWGEVHELAEQLQHIRSEKLVDRLYVLSGEPQFDPHGDPIPGKDGSLPSSDRRPLLNSVEGCRCVVLGVFEDSPAFLNYLTELRIGLNDKLTVEKIFLFDGSVKVRYKTNERAVLSSKVAEKILVTCMKEGCLCKS